MLDAPTPNEPTKKALARDASGRGRNARCAADARTFRRRDRLQTRVDYKSSAVPMESAAARVHSAAITDKDIDSLRKDTCPSAKRPWDPPA
jgi:hypothetical protein